MGNRIAADNKNFRQRRGQVRAAGGQQCGFARFDARRKYRGQQRQRAHTEAISMTGTTLPDTARDRQQVSPGRLRRVDEERVGAVVVVVAGDLLPARIAQCEQGIEWRPDRRRNDFRNERFASRQRNRIGILFSDRGDTPVHRGRKPYFLSFPGCLSRRAGGNWLSCFIDLFALGNVASDRPFPDIADASRRGHTERADAGGHVFRDRDVRSHRRVAVAVRCLCRQFRAVGRNDFCADTGAVEQNSVGVAQADSGNCDVSRRARSAAERIDAAHFGWMSLRHYRLCQTARKATQNEQKEVCSWGAGGKSAHRRRVSRYNRVGDQN